MSQVLALPIALGGTGANTAAAARAALGITNAGLVSYDVSVSGAIPAGKTLVLVTTGADVITLTLPGLPSGSPPITIMKVDAGSGSVAVNATINGSGSGYDLINQYQFVVLGTDGSNILVIGKN